MSETVQQPAELCSVGWLRDFAGELEQAPREGAAEDVPEGSRTVRLSDTLAKTLVEYLRVFLAEKRAADLSGVVLLNHVSRKRPSPPSNRDTREGGPLPK